MRKLNIDQLFFILSLLLPQTFNNNNNNNDNKNRGIVVSAEEQTLTWESRSGYNGDGRHHPITFANETHGFLFSGSTDASSTTMDFYMYEESSDTWVDLSSTVGKSFPGGPISFGYGVVLNSAQHSKAYLGFGVDSTGARLSGWYSFDMGTHTWDTLSTFPGPGRRHPAVVPVKKKSPSVREEEWEIHVGLGDGYVNGFSNFDDWWSYDITSDSWTQLSDFPSSKRHHPFYFGLGDKSYVGLGHSDGTNPYIERDWYMYDSEERQWTRDTDFASYSTTVDVTSSTFRYSDQPVTTEARVAGTEFSIELPLDTNSDGGSEADSFSGLSGSLGFVLSGDGDDHRDMATGEFHAFYPPMSDNENVVRPGGSGSSGSWWRELPPHPGRSRWAPGSFVMRGSARVYFTSGYSRQSGTLYSDLWYIDLSSLFAQKEKVINEPVVPMNRSRSRSRPKLSIGGSRSRSSTFSRTEQKSSIHRHRRRSNEEDVRTVRRRFFQG